MTHHARAGLLVDPERPHAIFLTDDEYEDLHNMWRAMGLTCLQVAPGDF